MNEWDTLIPLVSAARLQPYLNAANQNKEKALELYKINIKLSETLYPFFSIFEVTLRNRIATVLINKYGENWFNGNRGKWVDGVTKMNANPGTNINSSTGNLELDALKKVKEKLNKDRINIIYDNIIAELNLGFWIGLLIKKSYRKEIWHHHIADLFPNVNPKHYTSDKKQKQMFTKFDNIKHLRNRVFHHDPIVVSSYSFQKLLTTYLEGYKLISWLSKDICRLLTSQDIFLKTVVEIPGHHWAFLLPSSSNSQLIISKIVDFQENI